MHFATHGVFKSVIAAKTAASIAWAANAQGDRLGGLVFSEQQHEEIRPARGKRSVLRLIQLLEKFQQREQQQDETLSTEQALSRLRRVTRPGSLIFLISDFRNLGEQAFSHITQLSRHSDVVLFFIYDRLEKELPPQGQYNIRYHERKLYFDSTQQNREQYQQQFLQRHNELVAFAHRHKLSFIECSTEQEPLEILMQVFKPI